MLYILPELGLISNPNLAIIVYYTEDNKPPDTTKSIAYSSEEWTLLKFSDKAQNIIYGMKPNDTVLVELIDGEYFEYSMIRNSGLSAIMASKAADGI